MRRRFRWTDDGWRGVELTATVLYELHLGTFTAEGTFDAAIGQLDRLARLGVTTVELMPVNAFPGRRNWGYDGVFPSAVQESYGGPEGLARFVDAAHGAGLAVVLDVVYNHLGPEGSVHRKYGPYFSTNVPHAVGRRAQRVGGRQRPRPPDVHRERDAVGDGLPRRRPAARRHRHDLRPDGRAVPGAARRGGAGRRTVGRPNGADVRRERGQRPDPRAPALARRHRRRRGVERRRAPRPPGGPDRRSARLLRRLRRRRRPRPRLRPTLGVHGSLLTVPRAAPWPARRRRRRRPLRGVQLQPRPRRQHASGCGGPRSTRAGAWSPLPPCCCRRSRRCCSWARSTARPARSRSSSTTPARTCWPPCARAAGGSSAAASGRRRWPIPTGPATFDSAVLDPSVIDEEPHRSVLAAYTELLALRRRHAVVHDPEAEQRVERIGDVVVVERRVGDRRSVLVLHLGDGACGRRPRRPDPGGGLRRRRRAVGRRRPAVPSIDDGRWHLDGPTAVLLVGPATA